MAEQIDTPRRRSKELLNKTLATLTNFIWTGRTRPGDHLWSIPTDLRRDFDVILSDCFIELEARRAAMREAGLTLPGWDET